MTTKQRSLDYKINFYSKQAFVYKWFIVFALYLKTIFSFPIVIFSITFGIAFKLFLFYNKKIFL